jgi:two-component sensor histidine kinase
VNLHRLSFLTKIFLIFASQALAQKNLSYYDSLFGLAENYKNEKQYEKAIAIYERIKNSGEWMDDLSNARKVFNNRGFVFYKMQNYDLSAINYSKSNQIAIALKDTAKIIGSYKSIAMAYRQMGLYAKSLENNQKALILAQAVQDRENILDIMNSMGLVYYNLKQLDKSLASHREALTVSMSNGDSLSVSYMYNNIAMSHFELGMYDSSLYYNLKALSIKKLLGLPKIDQVANLNNIGEDYLELDSLELAEKYLSEAYKLYIEGGNVQGQITISNNLAKLAIKKMDYGAAQSYLDIVAQLFENVYVKDIYLDYVELRTELSEKQGQHAEALAYHKELSSLKEEVFQEEKLKVQQVESSYLLREKELERATAAQEAVFVRAENERYLQLILILAASVLVTGSLLYFLLRLNKMLKVKNNIIQSQKEDLKHRTFNVLMRVQSLIRMASESLTDETSKRVLANSEAAILSAASLQQHLSHDGSDGHIMVGSYLEDLVYRLEEVFHLTGHKISYKVEIQEESPLPVSTVLNLGIIVAELVTNASKHAFNEQIAQPEIAVRLEKKGPNLIISVRDNGIGLPQAEKQGVGTGLIKKLAGYIKAELAVRSEGGTFYTLKLHI